MIRGKQKTCRCGECRICRHREVQRRHREKTGKRHESDSLVGRENERRKLAARMPEGRKKDRAHGAVYRAIRRGDLQRGECKMKDETCKGRIEAHHDDYDKPLEVRWLCARHHSQVES